MTKTTVVTSCSAKGWTEYGERFVRTFLEHWPRSVGLVLVSEDLSADAITGKEWPRPFVAIDLYRASPRASVFHREHQFNRRAHGKERVPGNLNTRHHKRIAAGYDFRFDAYKFAKKVFAIEVAAQWVGSGRLFWVDADVVTFAPVSMNLLDRMLPKGAALSCLSRGDYHSECGFVGYNLDDPRCLDFILAFGDLYITGDVFGLQEWHDSWVFDWLRKRMGIPTFSIPHRSRQHPFVNSDLGAVMDHVKGARKEAGRTPRHEMVVGHKADYWRGAGT